MDITETAKQYAERKIEEALTEVVEHAFLDGYTAGYADGISKQKSALSSSIKGVEYVDLQLPSGTKWSSSYLTNQKGEIILFTYDEALQMNIPTLEQFEELKKYCELTYKPQRTIKEMRFSGRNGNWITLCAANIMRANEICLSNSFMFWLDHDQVFEGNRKLCGANSKTYEFMGNRIPVMLVSVPKK